MEFVDFTQWGTRVVHREPVSAPCTAPPTMPSSLLRLGIRSTVPLMTGTTRNEATGFLAALGLLPA